ncbi:unknown [Alistipes sp. CAG:53]|nr:unknown [Alistipes sp. CAG:53]
MLFGLALLVEGELRGISGRLLLYATRLERKRELINTRESQQDRNEFNKTFTLHLSEK